MNVFAEKVLIEAKKLFKKYDVLYISYDDFLEPLASAQIIPYLKGLARKGISCLALDFAKNKDCRSAKDVSRVEQELSSLGIRWRRLRYHKYPLVLSTFFDVIYGTCLSFWLIRKYEIKIVHARSYVAAIIALILQKICRVKFIFDMRGFWVDERVEAGIWKRNAWLYKLGKYFEQILLKNADVIISLTQAARKAIEKYPCLSGKQIDIVCIPTCVDLDRFRYKSNGAETKIGSSIKGKIVLAYAGSISTWFMPEQMLSFFQSAIRCIPLAHLLVLTKEKTLFEGILRDYGFRKDLVSVINAEHSLVADYLSLGRAGLAFYKPGSSRRGCCPTKIGEYLACGLPVIINSGIGDTEQILQKEQVGIIVKEFTNVEYERVSCRLQELLKDKTLGQRCRQAAYRYFALDEGIESYQQAYHKLLQR